MVTGVREQETDKPVNKLARCGSWVMVSECSTGDAHYGKKIYCGKEWCPVCSQEKSPAHNRRIARVLPKVMQMGTMGYLVIEFPIAYRKSGRRQLVASGRWTYSKEDLKDTTKKIVEVLAGKRTNRTWRVGGIFSRGLLRWHWFGDKNIGKYNPHANVLVDGGFIEPAKLKIIKRKLKQRLNCPDLIVHYSFCSEPAQMFHKVEYITRATFTNYHWDEYMANELYGFRNQRWWGNWKQPAVWDCTKNSLGDIDINEYLAVSKLQKGCCTKCGSPLKILRYSNVTGKPVMWSRPVDSTWLMIWSGKELANSGYYEIPFKEWHDVHTGAKGVLN